MLPISLTFHSFFYTHITDTFLVFSLSEAHADGQSHILTLRCRSFSHGNGYLFNRIQANFKILFGYAIYMYGFHLSLDLQQVYHSQVLKSE